MTLLQMIDEVRRQVAEIVSPPVYSGPIYDTECTCRVRKPGCAWTGGRWRSICCDCGSLRL